MQAPNFGEGLEATLDGCKIAMEVLAEDVSNLLGLDELEYVQVCSACHDRHFHKC